MGPPAPVNHPSISSSPSVPSSSGAPPTSAPPHPPPAVATHKESGMSLVQRLLGEFHQNQCSMQEWEDRRRFYERLVNFCETKGHPLTGQPTVSKQTVDLYRLYMSVKQNGGFEQVGKNAKKIMYFFFLFNYSHADSKTFSRFFIIQQLFLFVI